MKSKSIISTGRKSLALSILLVLLSTGCTVFPDSPAAKLYALELAPMTAFKTCPVKFAVREVGLPGYLNRPELVLGGDQHQVRASAQHLWAAPLSSELTRLTALGLQEVLGGSQAMPYPVRQFERPDWVLSFEVKRVNQTSRGLSMEVAARAYRTPSKANESLATANLTIGPWASIQTSDYASTASAQDNAPSSPGAQAVVIARSLSDALGKNIQSLGQEFAKVICP